MMLRRAEDPINIFEKMSIEPLKKDGKKLFTNRGKYISDVNNMYKLEHDKINEYYHDRHAGEFPDRSKQEYIAPPVVRQFDAKLSYVHNMVANKSKTNYAHLEKTMKMTNPQKVKILQALHDNEVDPSILSVLKNILFEHESVVDNFLFPVSEWEEVRVYETNTLLDKVSHLIVEECKT